jgi:LacI family transcriptional regulator, galactose operon repressor
MKPKSQITLTDIAQKLSISKVSVSKALRDHPDISTKLKKRVKETASELGYVPNFMARNLSSKKSNTIGLVVPKIAHHFFAEAIESIYKTAYQNNYEIIMTVSQENEAHEQQHLETLMAMRVDGLLISITEHTKDMAIFEKVLKRGVPLVFFDRVLFGLGFRCVTTDDEQGSYDAISFLAKKGYKNIAHLAGYQNSNIGYHRALGYKNALKKFGLTFLKKWFVVGGFGEADGYRGFKNIMKNGPLPEVVFAVTFPVALGAIVAANELGLSVPGDVDILSFGGSGYNRFMQPALTYMQQPVPEIGKTAIKLLIDEIKNGETGTQNIKLPTKLVVCDTCLKGDDKL